MFNAGCVQNALNLYSQEIVGLNLNEWLKNPLNIALINEQGDVAMFEHQHTLEKTVCAHYFFFSRGRQAIDASKQFLHELFTEHYPECLIGLTPENHKAALWMNRQIGVKEHGTIQTEIGPCRFVMLTKQQWKEQNT